MDPKRIQNRSKIGNGSKTGPERVQNGSKTGPESVQNGSKMILLQTDGESIGNILGPIQNYFKAFLTISEPANGPNYNGNGPFWDQKMVKIDTPQIGLGTQW